MTDENFMRLALQEAKAATQKGNWPIGCVIILDGQVIAKAHNLVYSSESRVAHAELIAIDTAQSQIFKRPNEAVLYTTYEPCPMCLGACLNARLKKVVYGVDLNDSGATGLIGHLPQLYNDGNYNTEFVGGMLANECEAVYRKGEDAVLAIRKALSGHINNK